jgi:DNA (cytosine-5)-methyltransferase 1
MARLIEELRPKYLIGENVRGFVKQPMGLERSLSDLESLGYSAVPFIIGACSVDAPHRRSRVWVVGAKNDTDADSERPHREAVNEQREDEPADGEERVVGQVRSVLAGSGDASERRSASVADAVGERQREKRRAKGRRRISGPSSSMADAAQLHSDGGKFHGKYHETKKGKFGRGSGTKSTPCPGSERLQGAGHEPRETGDAGAGQPMQLGSEVRGEWSAEPGMGGVANGVPGWLDEPDCGRVASGIKNRVPRLKSLGNAVVPQVVAEIGKAILAAEDAG